MGVAYYLRMYVYIVLILLVISFPISSSVCNMEGDLNASPQRSRHNVDRTMAMATSQPRPTLQDEVAVEQLEDGRGGLESKQPRPLQDCCSREKLKRHRDGVAGRVMIPDSWGQERFMTDWIEYSTFDVLLGQKKISSAREALMADGRRAAPERPRIEISRC
ncbi:hypothetical protein SAY87_015643 [Trapa incisa]|uniref:Uncharacterized protein n=1 Tax=Trapa incisa TaxID=236973 RepID=A0AAN7QUT3_9MYRT|nr:hypothetical protein SAY87_015643 [Trapa incisa]